MPTYPDLVTQAEVLADLPKLQGRPNLAALISRASQAVQRHVGQVIGPRAVSGEVYDGDNSPVLYLKQFPAVAVTQVTIDGDVLDNTDGTAYTLKGDTGELVRGRGQEDRRFATWWPRGDGNITVSYTAGEPVPDDLKQAVILTVAYYAGAPKYVGLVSSESIGDYDYEVPSTPRTGLPDIARSILSPFVRDWIL